MATTVGIIIDRLGGAEAAARLTGVSTEAVRKWRQGGAIPSRHWATVIAATGLALTDLQAEPAGEKTDMTDVPEGATACLMLADGAVFWGRGIGAHTPAEGPVGEVCFNTGMTGYQETLTDPSYAGQIITFTFPHIGNVGTNNEDLEAAGLAARGLVVQQDITEPSNWRSAQHLDAWLKARNVTGVAGVDTRAITARIRDGGAPNGVLAFPADGRFDLAALRARASGWPGLEGMDLAKDVTTLQAYNWDAGLWALGNGAHDPSRKRQGGRKVVVLDYGIKTNILRNLVDAGCEVIVLPASASFAEIMAHNPDGLFLSNGPGDPAATGEYAVGVIQQWLDTKKPLFGICLGHQMLALAVGGKTVKMHQGHRGANHPVKRLADGAVEITSMNHGFAVERETLPAHARETHVSLFDGSNCGFELTDRPAFSVQYHPEASPGPMDSHYLFEKFVEMMG